MDEKLTKRLIQAKKIVKQKYDQIRSNQKQAEEILESQYTPLKNIFRDSGFLNQNIKSEIKKEENESFTMDKDDSINTNMVNKLNTNVTSSSVTRNKEVFPIQPETTFVYDPTNDSYFEDRMSIENEDEKSKILRDTTLESFNLYLDQYDKLPRKYISGHIRDTSNEFDTTYLKHNLLEDKFYFGDSEIEFQDNNILVQGERFNGTEGLYELIFKTKPKEKYITNKDRLNYGKLIKKTNANKRNFNPENQTVGTRSQKYTSIIKPIMQALQEEEKLMQKKYMKTGKGVDKNLYRSTLMKYNPAPTNYVYFNDANELVERLQLLIASQLAGHNNHRNEIISILEELCEEGIITKESFNKWSVNHLK